MTDVLTAREEIEGLIKGRSVAHAFADTVAEQGDNPAFSDKIGIEGPGWRTLSWQEVREQGLDLAAAFVELGVQPGDRIAIMSANRVEHVLADIGAMHAGATPMSIYNTLSASQVAYVAEHSEPRVVILETADHLQRWNEALATGKISHLVVIDPSATPDGALSWDDLVALGRSVREQHAAEVDRRWQDIDPDHPATILYTSGTTGPPKGVVISHRSVLFEVESGNRTAGLQDRGDEENITVSYLPFAHIAERVLGIYIPQVGGGHVHLIGDPHSWSGPWARCARLASSACPGSGRRSRPASVACSRWRPTRPRSRPWPTRWPSGWSTSSRWSSATRPVPTCRRSTTRSRPPYSPR